MKILRTPDERFADLPDWPWQPRYTTIDAGDGTPLRMACVDEGPRDADPIVLMHGNPSWSYLYRHMIPGLLAAGHRVVAVDLVGLGRSDKPAAKSDYTLDRHVQWMRAWYEAMELEHVTLFCQDWGGTIGLHMVADMPWRFDRVIAANTGIPLGEGGSKFLEMWVSMMREATEFPWAMFPQGMMRDLSEKELAAYLAPFPSPEYQAGITEFPVLIAVQPDNPGVARNRAAWEKLATFDRPFLTLWGMLDAVARGADKRMHAHIPGCAGQPHQQYANANHFLQEDVPAELVEATLRFVASTPRA